MSPSRVLALAGRILKQFRHDKRTVGLIVIVPVLVMALIGYLIGEEGKEPLPVAVVEEGAPNGPLALALDRQPGVHITQQAVDREIGVALLRRGDVVAAVIAGAGETLGGLRIELVVRGVDPGVDGAVLGAVRSALENAAAIGAGGTGPAITIERLPLEGAPGLGTIDYYAPVLVAVFAFFFTFLLTSVSFLRERSSGTLERLMASPATRLEVLLGYLLGFIGFAMAQALIVLGYATMVLDVHVAGSVWLVLLILAVLVIGVVNLGIALSFYARNELQVVQFIPVVLLPQTFLGGLVWPVETLYPALRWLSQVLPLTHATVALRAVMVGGEGFGDVLGRFLALLAFSVAMVVLGVLALRKQRA